MYLLNLFLIEFVHWQRSTLPGAVSVKGSLSLVTPLVNTRFPSLSVVMMICTNCAYFSRALKLWPDTKELPQIVVPGALIEKGQSAHSQE